MGFDCEDCCRSCCYSTPFFTFSVVGFTVIGLIGFLLSSFYGVAKLDTLGLINNGTAGVIAPVVCGAFLLTLIPLVLITIMSYCITGYIRDILLQPIIKSCIGNRCYNVTLLLMALVFVLMWVLISIGLGGIMVYHVQTMLTCRERRAEVKAGNADRVVTCLSYVDTSFNYLPICNSDLDDLCAENDLDGVGLSFSISILFTIAVLMGLVILALIHASNFVSARDHIDYRENTRTEYDMKRVR